MCSAASHQPANLRRRRAAGACSSALYSHCDGVEAYIDPYIRVALMPWHVEAKTPHVEDYDPEKHGHTITYNHELMLEMPDDHRKKHQRQLVVQAWDDDLGTDDLCGQGTVEEKKLREIIDSPGVVHKIEIEMEDQFEESAGTCQLEITFKKHREPGGRRHSAAALAFSAGPERP